MAHKKETPDFMKVILDRIDKVTDETRKDIGEMKTTLTDIKVVQGSQAVTLAEHIRRTIANEEALRLHTDKEELEFAAVGTRLVPLEKHVWMWSGVGKALAILGTLSAIAGAVYKFYF